MNFKKKNQERKESQKSFREKETKKRNTLKKIRN